MPIVLLLLLQVEPPDVLTRVSEYLPEIVLYIERILATGFAYKAPSGSIYFDTVRYANAEGHRYGKLVPEAVGDLKLVAEGEGVTCVQCSRSSYAILIPLCVCQYGQSLRSSITQSNQ